MRITCPECGRHIRHGVSVGYQPTFVLAYQVDHNCRLCVFRHPVTRAVIVRSIPHRMRWEDYFPIVVQELRAIARNAGLL